MEKYSVKAMDVYLIYANTYMFTRTYKTHSQQYMHTFDIPHHDQMTK